MRLAVLDLCKWLPEFQQGQDKFGDVTADYVKRALPEAELAVVAIVEGADFPNVDAFDGYILTGSDKGVYDAAPWMAPLRAFLLAAKDSGKPLFGICFGHQVMADVFGGKAEKVSAPEVGVRTYDIPGGGSVTGHAWHQDQVTQVPPGAEVTASAAYCPVAALSYEFPALSVQFHPEYAPDYLTRFLSRSRGEVLGEEHTDTAVAEIEAGNVRPDLFTRDVGDFFRAAIGKATPS